MKRVVRLACLWITIFALLIGGSVLVGHGQARPEFFRYFGRCSDVPCYTGIVAGQTGWSDIETRFEISTALRGDTEINLAYAPPGFIGTLRFFPSGSGLLAEVDLRFHTTRLKLGDIVAEMGTPCAVAITRRLPLIIYPSMGVLVVGEQMGAAYTFTPEATVTGINLLGGTSCDISNRLALYPWRGFGRYVS